MADDKDDVLRDTTCAKREQIFTAADSTFLSFSHVNYLITQ